MGELAPKYGLETFTEVQDVRAQEQKMPSGHQCNRMTVTPCLHGVDHMVTMAH
jgi:ribosomal protein L37AE/L43A